MYLHTFSGISCWSPLRNSGNDVRKSIYLLEFLKFHCSYQTSKGMKDVVQECQIVTAYDEGQPRGLWRVGRIEGVIQGADGKIQSMFSAPLSKTQCWSNLHGTCIHSRLVLRKTWLIHSLRSRTTILSQLLRHPEDNLAVQLLSKHETRYSGT